MLQNWLSTVACGPTSCSFWSAVLSWFIRFIPKCQASETVETVQIYQRKNGKPWKTNRFTNSWVDAVQQLLYLLLVRCTGQPVVGCNPGSTSVSFCLSDSTRLRLTELQVPRHIQTVNVNEVLRGVAPYVGWHSLPLEPQQGFPLRGKPWPQCCSRGLRRWCHGGENHCVHSRSATAQEQPDA